MLKKTIKPNNLAVIFSCVGLILSFVYFIVEIRAAGNVSFTADTIVSLSGITDGSLYIASSSQATSASINGATLTVGAIPDGDDFILKTSTSTIALKLTPSGGTVDLTFAGSSLSTGYISQWTLTATGATTVAQIVDAPLANTSYSVNVDGSLLNSYQSTAAGEVSFTYSGGWSSKVFTIEESSTIEAPTIGTPAALSSSSVRWNFTDNANNETGFRLYDSSGNLTASSSNSNLSYLDESGLSENTGYSRYVRAFNANDSSASSSAASAYTLADTPTNLAATVSSQSVSLSVDTFPNSASSSSGYYFYRTNDESNYNSGWIQTNSWQDIGVFNCNITYTWAVKYRNGDGTQTSAVSITPSSIPKTCGGATLFYDNIIYSATSSTVSIPITTSTSLNISESTQITLESIKVKIAGILAKINDLKTQISQIQNHPTELSRFSGFPSSLKKGMRNNDVKKLQQFLNSDPDTKIISSGLGSPGNETNYFGSLTEKAVKKFQLKYKLVFSENDTGYGYVGPKTRAKLKEIFGK